MSKHEYILEIGKPYEGASQYQWTLTRAGHDLCSSVKHYTRRVDARDAFYEMMTGIADPRIGLEVKMVVVLGEES